VPLCLCANPNPNPSRSPRQQLKRSVSIEAEYTYCAFGNLIEGNDHDNPYGFTGEQQFNEPDGLIFLRARYYDPSVGRFISRDPLGMIDGPNMYLYVHNNPVNYIDPTGMIAQTCGKITIEKIERYEILFLKRDESRGRCPSEKKIRREINRWLTDAAGKTITLECPEGLVCRNMKSIADEKEHIISGTKTLRVPLLYNCTITFRVKVVGTGKGELGTCEEKEECPN
jgi:RHS repeat-associated protein